MGFSPSKQGLTKGIMSVNSISSINMQGQKKGSWFDAPNLGYVSAAGMGLAALTSMSKNKTIHKSHKTFAIIALAAMLAHILKVTSRG
jgi:hypothetical protein